MARYEWALGKSSKFSEISLEGTSFTVTFGRIGTAGQSQKKTFASAAEAKREHDKLVAEKIEKGYALARSHDAPAMPAKSATPAKKSGTPNAATLAALPLAVIDCDDLERELLSVRTDDPALPVSIFTEGTFFQLWTSLADLVAELRGTRVGPIAALKKQMADAQRLEDKEKYADAAAMLEAALGELEVAILATKDGEDVIESARHRAGYCRYRCGDLEAAERHYAVSAEHGGSAAAFNLVRMAVERKDFVLAAQRVEAFSERYAFGDESRLEAFRYRALAWAMLGCEAKARAALADIEKQCFARDDFGKEVDHLSKLFDEVGVPAAPAAKEAVAAIRVEASKLVAAWNESRGPKTDESPRKWWDGLDEIARMVFKANLRQPDSYQVPYEPKATEASDEDLERILGLKSFRSFTVAKKEPGKFFAKYSTLVTLAPLARLTALESIDLEEAGGPYSLAPLAGLTKLRVLKLPSVKVDDVTPLAGLPIEELVLKSTEVEDLAPLAKLPRLRHLDIWMCPTRDLSPLAKCVELRELVAGDTQARELPQLPELVKLEVADFRCARFGRKDVDAFKKAHPSCNVEYTQAKD